MKAFFKKEILAHPIVLSSLAAVAVISVGSGTYYIVASQAPKTTTASALQQTLAATVTGTGVVTPAQNPNLAFAAGGRVASVSVAVGQSVAAGQLLASLDLASLSAQKTQAEASLAAAQAKLDGMQAGPRDTDVSVKKTAVAQAQLALNNLYANVPDVVTNTYQNAFNQVRSTTDTLFSQPNSSNPALLFQTSNSQAGINVANDRVTLNSKLADWGTKVAALSAQSSPDAADAALQNAIDELVMTRQYTGDLLVALASAVPSGAFPQASITATQASIGGLNTSVNALILSLQGTQQQIASAKLAVESAQDVLNQTLAGAAPQDIEAQQAQVRAAEAQVESVNAQIANAVIVAPFSGTVSSVAVKTGQIVAPNTVGVSLTPESALQVEIFVSEIDVAKLLVGNSASVTLDAYGSARTFAATVVTIDRSPTMQNGIPAYKVTLQFAHNDPAITQGQTANATISITNPTN